MKSVLQLEDVTVRYGRLTAADHVSLTLRAGDWLMLAGPNGAGKSTLVRAVAQGVPYTGRVTLDGKDVSAMRPCEVARQIGVLSQHHQVSYAYTVDEIVALGRYAHEKGFLSRRDGAGREKMDQALEMTGLTHLRNASMLTLSGGEMQRAFLAQVFAQDPRVLILDEPVNHLDLKYQQHIFELIREWLSQGGRAVLSVVHDLSLARRYGTRAALMRGGRVVASGETGQVFTPENLNAVYEMNVGAWMRGLLEGWAE